MVAGQITNYLGNDPNCTPHVYSAGQSFTDKGGADVHMIRNNGTVQAETIAVQFLPKGTDRKIDEPDPLNCHFEPVGSGKTTLRRDRSRRSARRRRGDDRPRRPGGA